MERVGGVEHHGRLRLRERAETDPVRQVGVEATEAPALDALARQQQVHADRATDAPDRQQQLHEVGLRREQLAELVDHQEQVRQRRQLGTVASHLPVVTDGCRVPGILQQALSTHDFALDARTGALGQLRVVREVVDDARDVREAGERGERRTTLVVDEDHAEVVGGVRERESQDQRAQQLALARAGRADADAVRAHAELRGLLQVEQDRAALVVDADRHAQELRGAAGAPRGLRVDGIHVGDAEELRHVGGEGGAAVLRGRAREAQPRERTGDDVERGGGHGIDPDATDRRVAGARRLHGRGARVHRDADGDRGRLLEAVVDQVHDGDAERGQIQRGIQARDGRGGVIGLIHEDHQAPGLGLPARAARGGGGRDPVAQLVAQERQQLGQARRDATGADRTGGRGVAGEVRQQVEPVPVIALRGSDGRRDVHVVGGVERRDLRRQRPRDAERVGPRAHDRHLAAALEIDGRGHALRDPGQAHHALGGLAHHRVERLDGVLLGRQGDLDGAQIAGADAHAEEVGIPRSTFPPAGRVGRDLHQRARGGVQRQRGGALRVGGLTDALARLLQIVEVALALNAALTGRVAALRERHSQAADERDHQDDGTHHDHDRVVAQQHDHRDRRQAAHDRQQRLQREAGRALADRRRRREDHVGRGLDGLADARGAVDDADGHAVLPGAALPPAATSAAASSTTASRVADRRALPPAARPASNGTATTGWSAPVARARATPSPSRA